MRSLDDVKQQAKLGFSPSRRSTLRNEMSSSQILPDRFRDEDDANDDVTAPPMGRHAKHAHMPYMAQSIFSMIAAVGSKSDFHSRFDESSDSDADEANEPPDYKPLEDAGLSSDSPSGPGEETDEAEENRLPPAHAEYRGRHRRKPSPDLTMLPPVSKLSLRERRKHAAEDQAQSVCTEIPMKDAPSRRSRSLTPRLAPVLTRMLEAQARFRRADRSTESVESSHQATQRDSPQSSTSSLSVKLMEIFGFEKPEKVLAEYACSLLQSGLLQGYMYVTEGHVCFYAYLPRKSNVAVRTGYLSKRGKKNPKYNRYWFSLKGDVLAYYAEPSNLYFPSGHIDLRYGISASLTESKTKEQDPRDFEVATAQRTYHFRADSSVSAKDWVKALQTVIFRTRNDGDSIKLSFPLENIIDIEESSLGDVAATLKIRAVESGETYAIDEYYFSFFDSGGDAYSFLKNLIEGSSDQRDIGQHRSGASAADRAFEHRQRRRRPSVSDPHSAERGNISRRRSASTSQLAAKPDLANEPRSARRRRSSDLFVNDLEQGTESSALVLSMPVTSESASQILDGSDVFKAPTIHSLRRRQSESGPDSRRQSQETARSVPAQTDSLEAGTKSGPDMQYPASESDQDQSAYLSTQSPAATLHELVKAGAYPLQRAAGFAEFLKSRSKQMSNLLATESMGYLEKVSGMWAGGGRHYGESERILPGDLAAELEDTGESSRHGDRFRAHFALPPTEKLQATYYTYLHRVLPLYGKIYISQRKLCFRSLIPGTRTKMILPIKDVENVEKEKGFRLRYHGLVIIIRGHEELFFEFTTADARDDCAVTIHRNIESIRFLMESGLLAEQEKEEAEAAKAEHRMLQEARLDATDERAQPTLTRNEASDLHPIFDDPRASIINFKPAESLRITCLTIGSRGDVQPYIALCKGLLAEGHRPKIATHAEFEPWVRKYGIDFAPVDGDPAELMRICVENGMFTYSFLKEASAKFRGWIDDLLTSAWEGCRDCDLLIESPSAMAGIHIAEALRIPYFRAFTMPWTRTRAYPHAFAVPDHRMGGAYNYITYVMFDHIFWKAIAGQVNRWRKHELGLKATTLEKMQPNKVPFLYNYSPSVVPPPLDYPDWIRVTGYWFLNEGVGWEPPRKMAEFLERARADGKKVVYIGFGSIVVSDPAALTRTVVESVRKADVRCILSKGWSDRLGDPSSAPTEIPFPPEILRIDSAPHDWLFTQIDAAVHHGGAGTTGASLRAGIPTIIKPFFGDQFFFGTRVEDLGVGICMKKLNVSVFSRALWEATHSERMIVKARDLGERIRKENGVATAIQAIYRDLEYAKTLARQRSAASATPFSPKPLAQDAADSTSPATDDDDMDDSEEWTFIGGDDTDIDISRRMKERELAEMSSSESRLRLS